MNTKKSVVAKRRKAFPKTSIKFEERFKQMFYFPEIGCHPFPKQRAYSQANKRGRGVGAGGEGGREGRVI